MEKQEVIIEKEIKDQDAYDIEIQRMAQIIQDHIRLENHRTSVFIIYLIMVAVVYFILLFGLDVFAYRRL